MSVKKTYLSITNETTQRFTISVSQVDSYDWEGKNRPDRNFEGKTVAPGETLKEQEDLNSHAKSAWFRLTLTFSSGQTISFRSDQYNALEKNINDDQKEIEESTKYVYFVAQTTKKSDSLNSFRVNYIPYRLNSEQWMKAINGSSFICNFGIPGTNLSVSCSQKSGIYRTQDICQDTQLSRGIRYFDLYATVRNKNLYLSLSPHSNVIGKGELFNYIMKSFLNFLDRNPTETILVSLCEVGTPSPLFAETVITYLKQYGDRIYRADSIPILDDVRNKVVFFRRFPYNGVYGLNLYNGWPANGGGKIEYKATNRTTTKFLVQNIVIPEYPDQKSNNIENFLRFADHNNGAFVINCSYVEPMTVDFDLMQYAKHLNSRIFNYIQEISPQVNTGTLLMMYPNEAGPLLSTLLQKITGKK